MAKATPRRRGLFGLMVPKGQGTMTTMVGRDGGHSRGSTAENQGSVVGIAGGAQLRESGKRGGHGTVESSYLRLQAGNKLREQTRNGSRL